MEKEGNSWGLWYIGVIIGIFTSLLYLLFMLTAPFNGAMKVGAQQAQTAVPCTLPTTWTSSWLANARTAQPTTDFTYSNNAVVLFKVDSSFTTLNMYEPNKWYLRVNRAGTALQFGYNATTSKNTLVLSGSTNATTFEFDDNGAVTESYVTGQTQQGGVSSLPVSDICGEVNLVKNNNAGQNTNRWQAYFPDVTTTSDLIHPMYTEPVRTAQITDEMPTSGGGGGMDETTFRTVVSDYAVQGFALLITGFITYIIVKQFRYRR